MEDELNLKLTKIKENFKIYFLLKKNFSSQVTYPYVMGIRTGQNYVFYFYFSKDQKKRTALWEKKTAENIAL